MDTEPSNEELENREECEGSFWSGLPGGTHEHLPDSSRVPRSSEPGEDTPHAEGAAAVIVAASDSALADALDAELAEEDAQWERLLKFSFYETVEQLRDATDRHGWRAVVAQKRLARDAARQPSRQIDPELGAVRGRPSRQINVKLSQPDFEALKALAVQKDLPPSTMARMLVRRAIQQAAGLPSS